MTRRARSSPQTALVRSSQALARGKTLTERVREYFKAWLLDKLQTSVSTYRTDLEMFAAYRGKDDAAEALAELVQIANEDFGEAEAVLFGYRTAMTEQPVWDSTAARDAGQAADRVGLAPATINRRLSAIRSFIRVLRTAGQTKWTPETPGVKAGKFRDTSGVGDEVVQVLLDYLRDAVADESTPARARAKAYRDVAIVCLMANMALRKSSVRTLDLRHVDETRHRVHVLLKGDERNRIWKGCDTTTWAALERWIAIRGRAHGPLFTSFCGRTQGQRISGSGINTLLIELGKQLELDKRAKPHGFRHTAITRALAQGIPIEQVSRDFANHAKIETTMVYDDRRADGRDIAQSVSDSRTEDPQ